MFFKLLSKEFVNPCLDLWLDRTMKRALIFVSCAIISPLAGMAKAIPAIPLAKETTWLVHKTKVFPVDGIMKAGSLPNIGIKGTSQVSMSGPEAKLLSNGLAQAKVSITAVRNSLHWSVNSLVYPHELTLQNTNGNRLSVDPELRKDFPYIIMERLDAFEGKKLCGYWQDIFHLGGHQLSNNALILVPMTENIETHPFCSFKGKIILYDPAQGREKVEEILRVHGAPILYPCMKGINEFPGKRFNKNLRHQDVEIDGVSYKSSTISTQLQLDHTVPSSTEIIQLHDYGLAMSSPIRAALTLQFAISGLVGKQIEENSCFNYAKSKPDFLCSKCHDSFYCSRECQVAHFPMHKSICSQHKGRHDALIAIHQEYLQKLSLYGNMAGNQIIEEELTKRFIQVESTFINAREKELLKRYRNYLTGLLSYLNGTDQQSRTLRESYAITTLQGFVRFCGKVRDELSPLSTSCEGAL